MNFDIGFNKFVDWEDAIESLPKETISKLLKNSFRIIIPYEDVNDMFTINSGSLHLWLIKRMEETKTIDLDDIWTAKQQPAVKEVRHDSLHYLPMVTFMFSNEDDLETFKEDLALFKLSHPS